MIYSPSLMCIELDNIKQSVAELEAAGANRLHLDVMDGRYVSNFAMGLGDIRSVCRNAHVETELHLMILEPSKYVDLFAGTGADIIYFHPDADRHPTIVIQKILEAGKQPGIVLNPGTSIESVRELLYIVDKVLVMGVNPGHAGQIYLSYVDQKIRRLLEVKDKMSTDGTSRHKLEVVIDGACSLERMRRWSADGVDGFVLGTAALFGLGRPYREIIDEIKTACGDRI